MSDNTEYTQEQQHLIEIGHCPICEDTNINREIQTSGYVDEVEIYVQCYCESSDNCDEEWIEEFLFNRALKEI